MREDAKNLWVAALRTPGLCQGRNRLERNDGSQCCLGVLCRVAEHEGVKLAVRHNYFGVSFDREVIILPESVREWAGMKSPQGLISPPLPRVSPSGISPGSLAGLNDTGWTFAEIANFIEANWKTL